MLSYQKLPLTVKISPITEHSLRYTLERYFPKTGGLFGTVYIDVNQLANVTKFEARRQKDISANFEHGQCKCDIVQAVSDDVYF